MNEKVKNGVFKQKRQEREKYKQKVAKVSLPQLS